MKNENKIKVIVNDTRKEIPLKHDSTKVIVERIIKAIQPQFDKPLMIKELHYSFIIVTMTCWGMSYNHIIAIDVPEVHKQHLKCHLHKKYASLKNVIMKELNASAKEMRVNKIIMNIH